MGSVYRGTCDVIRHSKANLIVRVNVADVLLKLSIQYILCFWWPDAFRMRHNKLYIRARSAATFGGNDLIILGNCQLRFLHVFTNLSWQFAVTTVLFCHYDSRYGKYIITLIRGRRELLPTERGPDKGCASALIKEKQLGRQQNSS
jgi:hypothetical protein